MKNINKNNRGFTLIELAIVLVIIGVLLGGFLSTFGDRIDNTRRAETLEELEVIKQAIIGYAYANRNPDGPHLPCPDCRAPTGCTDGTANDGEEDRIVVSNLPRRGQCSVNLGGVNSNVGNLPWVTLGLGQGDVWDNRYRYWVDTVFARDGDGTDLAFARTFTLDDSAVGVVQTRTTGATQVLANNVVAVLYSTGKNGYGNISIYNRMQPGLPAANLDERENIDSDGQFISRPPTEASASITGGEFDDILIWIPEYELKAKMVEAGLLP